VPDLTSHYRYDDSWGHVQVAGILRRVGYEFRVDPTVNPQENWTSGYKTGWGVNLSAAIKTIDKDQILLQIVHGDGIATYMNDGGMDLAPNAAFNPDSPTTPALSAEAVPLTGVVAYYDHYWSEKLSTSIGYSSVRINNTNFQSPLVFHKAQYASTNLLWYPGKNILIGGEVLWGELEKNDGSVGNDVRFQFSAKYNFGISLGSGAGS
jgi:hypothetical protein